MYLELNDVSLFYEVRGEGEPLLLIHGLSVDSWFYENTAQILSRFYQVITYDRRGNSRSQAKTDLDCSVEQQSRDVKALLDALHISEVTIVGASAGSIIGEKFLEENPERVKKLIMYEAPMVGMMEDPEIQQWIENMDDLIARRKYSTALLKFMQSIASTDTRGPKKPEEVVRREMNNMKQCLETEFDIFIRHVPDLELSKKYADKITVAVGEKSNDTMYVRAAIQYAETIGAELLYYPGYHNLPCDLPKEFAICVLGTLMVG